MTTTPPPASPADDPFFQLLTDALRAGPGSAQWVDAVARLRDGGVKGADEYQLILRAREDVELGRDFRKVSAGPGFTRKVLDAVEREGRRRQGLPTATIVAILAGLVILGVIVTVIVIMSRGGGATTEPAEAAIRKLESASVPVSVASAKFETGMTWPKGWRAVTGLPLDFADGLKVSVAATAPSTQAALPKFLVGGVVTEEPVPADAAGVVEADLTLPPPGPGQAMTQLFVSDSPSFTPDASGKASREVVWTYRDGRASVDVGGQTREPVSLPAPAGENVKVSIRFDRETVIVEAAGRRLYAGPHDLPAGAPRYAGVRFIRAAGDAGASAAVRSLDVATSGSGDGGDAP